MAAPCPHRASLPQRALRRQDPRQEPGALIPHAGICPGGRPQGRSLPGLPAKPPNKAGCGCGGGGGKGTEPRGTRTGRNTPRTQCRARRAKRAGPCARGGTKGQGCAVHRAAAPCQPGTAGDGLLGPEPEGRAGGGRGDVGGLRAGPGGQPPGPARPGHSGPTGRGRLGGCTSRRRTGGCGRSASRRTIHIAPPAIACRDVRAWCGFARARAAFTGSLV